MHRYLDTSIYGKTYPGQCPRWPDGRPDQRHEHQRGSGRSAQTSYRWFSSGERWGWPCCIPRLFVGRTPAPPSTTQSFIKLGYILNNWGLLTTRKWHSSQNILHCQSFKPHREKKKLTVSWLNPQSFSYMWKSSISLPVSLLCCLPKNRKGKG